LGNSKEIAKRRFMMLEQRLARKPILREQHVQFMNEYIQLKHIKITDEAIIPTPHYFIPHHCVLKPSSSTTKLRVVYDASCKTSTDLSLNEILHTGPKLQQDLFDIFLRFRLYTYVFTGDIEKMYRQIRIHEDDTQFQIIYWRDEPGQKLKCYTLQTVTYGTTSAPYLATKCLQMLAERNKYTFPLASLITQTDFYVDDLMTGSDDLDEAIENQRQIRLMLQTAGFRLRKWCANHNDLLANVPPEDIELSLNIKDGPEEDVKTLGVTWMPKPDLIAIKTQ